MKRFVEGEDRNQVTLLPECLDDYVAEDNPVRVIDVFIDELDLTGLGFEVVAPADTGRPAYHPAVLLQPLSFCRNEAPNPSQLPISRPRQRVITYFADAG